MEHLPSFVYLLLLLLLVGSSLTLHFRHRISQGLRFAVIWIIGFILLIGAYGFRGELSFFLQRVQAELFPTSYTKTASGQYSFRKSSDGHFYVSLSVNNTPITFLVDTGASDIVLSQKDAKSLGINPDKLRYNKTYYTANGITYGASIDGLNFTLGDHVYHLPASVNQASMQHSLLGMRFLDRLSKFDISKEALILTP